MKFSKLYLSIVFLIMLSPFITAEEQNSKSNDIEYNLSTLQLKFGNGGRKSRNF
ncbi:hypothetical protein J7L48_04400 [bacterium]|nr:hypothetical protein [bacterium]